MKVSVLFSGSTGNCTYVDIDGDLYLIDAGVSCKKITVALDAHGYSLEQVKGVFLTHEHTDHVIGLIQLVDRRNIPLYTNKKTYHAIKPKYRPQNLEVVHLFENDKVEFFDPNFMVEAQRISHDVEEGSFYIFKRGDKKLVYITDTGYVAEKLYEKIGNADMYVLESNHEPDMVMQSRYPWHIKQRVISDEGHLSNEDSAILANNIVGDKTKNIVLAHLSQENNLPNRALQRMKEGLGEKSELIKIQVADPDNTHKRPIFLGDKK